jgi:hypothetical protein
MTRHLLKELKVILIRLGARSSDSLRRALQVHVLYYHWILRGTDNEAEWMMTDDYLLCCVTLIQIPRPILSSTSATRRTNHMRSKSKIRPYQLNQNLMV